MNILAHKILTDFLEEKKRLSTYREFVVLQNSTAPSFTTKDNSNVVNMCSNDYLGLSQRQQTLDKVAETLKHSGSSTGASRNISGTRPIHELLELELRTTYQTKDALLYTSGNNANSDIISVLSRTLPNSVFFSDSENHASLIESMRGLPPNRKHIFMHNDVVDLESKLIRYYCKSQIPIIVVETLYSMTGCWCPLAKVTKLAKQHNAILIINEVHAAGVVGKGGAGLASELGLLSQVDVIVGSLSKAFGSIGGYLVGDELLVDACRQSGTRSIFTTSLPEINCMASYQNIQHLRVSNRERNALRKRVVSIRKLLRSANINISGDINSHIIPVTIGSEERTKKIAQGLFKKGYYVTPISYPTVKKGHAMLRITVSSSHTMKQISGFVASLTEALRQD